MKLENTGIHTIKLKSGYNIIGEVTHSNASTTTLVKTAVIVADQNGNSSLVEYEPLAKDFKFCMDSDAIEHAAQITDAGRETYDRFVEELIRTHLEKITSE